MIELLEPTVKSKVYSFGFWDIVNPAKFGIEWAEDLKPGTKVFLRDRVSTDNQIDHLNNYKTFETEVCSRLKLDVVGSNGTVAKGWEVWDMKEMANEARKCGADVILASTLPRLIRNEMDAQETGKVNRVSHPLRGRDIRLLRFFTDRYRCSTIMNPNVNKSEYHARSHGMETAIGMAQKSAKNEGTLSTPLSIPVSVAVFKAIWQPRAVELRAQKMSYTEIAKQVTKESGVVVSRARVIQWINRA